MPRPTMPSRTVTRTAVATAAVKRRDVVVVGASAGGIEALLSLLGKLPADLEAAVLVVVHRNPFRRSSLDRVLGYRSLLPVVEPRGGEPVEPRTLYIAPRDHHMTVGAGAIRLDRGPQQHRTRPAVDPLFISAADEWGPRVVGVLLSGAGEDGVKGMIAVKRAGGTGLVQDPAEALHASMPLSALRNDHVDGVLPVVEIARMLAALAAGRTEVPT
jgi:two-component system, chemotaxis family, protein-glutamate methylesterase/glutaminase